MRRPLGRVLCRPWRLNFIARTCLHHVNILRRVSAVPPSAWWILRRTTLVRGSGMILVAICSVRSAGKSRRMASSSSLRSSAVEWARKPPRTRVSPSSPPSSCQSVRPWDGGVGWSLRGAGAGVSGLGLELGETFFDFVDPSFGFVGRRNRPSPPCVVFQPSFCSFEISRSNFLKFLSF